jgi:hypothetical protein
MSEPLDERELGDYIDQRYRSPGDTLFRMETLPGYLVDTDGDDYRRWLDGAEEPTWSRKGPWLDTLRMERRNGQVSRRVRLLSAAVTPYERYSCAFGYVHNVEAGEDIRILRTGEHAAAGEVIARDFWIINDEVAVVMHYDPDGRFRCATPAPDLLVALRAERDAAWAAAEPFTRWWARHIELHRP